MTLAEQETELNGNQTEVDESQSLTDYLGTNDDEPSENTKKRRYHLKTFSQEDIEQLNPDLFSTAEKSFKRWLGSDDPAITALFFEKYKEWEKRSALSRLKELESLASTLGFKLVPESGESAIPTGKTKKATQA